MGGESADHSQPLSGRTVVVTRARDQSKTLTEDLGRHGARVVAFPTIQIVQPDSFDAVDRAIGSLNTYDWLIFTSANGVDSFLYRLRTLGYESADIDRLKVCAIGGPTAAKLLEKQVHVDVIPDVFSAEGLLVALERYMEGSDKFADLAFLIPRAAEAREYLPKALQKAGARVDIVPVYKTVPVSGRSKGRLEAMLAGGAVDCVTFLSSSSVINFANIFGSGLPALLNGVVIASIGEITSNAIQRCGLPPPIQSKRTTVQSLVDVIVEHFIQE